MCALFQVTVSKSAIDRWVYEVGDSLPSEEEMIKLLHKEKPIMQGRFDELFPLGADKRLVALKDEHGRIIGANETPSRSTFSEAAAPQPRATRPSLLSATRFCCLSARLARCGPVTALCPTSTGAFGSCRDLTQSRKFWTWGSVGIPPLYS